MSLAEIVAWITPLLLGLAGALVLSVGVFGLLVVEGLWLDPGRGAFGTAARALWIVRRPGRDADAGTSFLAAVCALVPPAIALTLVLRGDHITPTLRDLVVVILLAMTVPVPVLFALAAGPEGRRRLALDDALARTARRGLYCLCLACVAGTVGMAAVAVAVAVGLVRQRLPQHGSLKPASDAGLQQGSRLALMFGRQAMVVVVLVLGLRALWPIAQAAGVPGGFVAGTVFAVVGGGVLVVTVVKVVAFVGPLRAEGLGPRGPLVLLVLSMIAGVVLRLT